MISPGLSSDASASSNWLRGLMLFLAVVALSLPQAALLPLLDRDEPRFAEASREMLQSGNYVVPTFNHEPRYAKPPLIYWCQTISYRLFGENALAARLPSLLATAGTAWLLFAWGEEVGGMAIGLGAALCYVFCLQSVQQGRVATADALLIFFMTLTGFAGWKLLATIPSRPPAANFWDVALVLGVAGGFLAKGPEALLPLLPLLFLAYRARHLLASRIVGNIVIGLTLVLLWAIPAYIETNGDYWRIGMSEGVGQRMVTGLQGHGATSWEWYFPSLFFYVALFWISALPWSPLILIHRKKLCTAWKWDRLDTYLLLNSGLIFLIFSLMVTKLPHYTLPAFPFLTLLLARRWSFVGFSSSSLVKLGWLTGIIFAVLTTTLVPVALVNHLSPSPTGELVRKAANSLTQQTEFAVVDFREPNTIWEMRRVTNSYGKFIAETKVISFLNEPGSRAVVISSSLWQKLGKNSSHMDPSWKAVHARGWNAAKVWDWNTGSFAYLDLTLVVKE